MYLIKHTSSLRRHKSSQPSSRRIIASIVRSAICIAITVVVFATVVRANTVAIIIASVGGVNNRIDRLSHIHCSRTPSHCHNHRPRSMDMGKCIYDYHHKCTAKDIRRVRQWICIYCSSKLLFRRNRHRCSIQSHVHSFFEHSQPVLQSSLLQHL